MFTLAVSDSALEKVRGLDELLVQFLASLDIKESSKQTYARQLKEFFIWAQKNSSINLEREDIIRYKQYLIEKKELSALTIGGYLTALRRFFEWLESVKRYPNIAKSVRGPKRKRGFKKDALSIAQSQALLAGIDRSTLQGMRDYALINLMLRTGLRTIEVIRATKQDIGPFSGVTVLWIHGKGRDSKDEFVVLTQKALDPINDYLAKRGSIKEGAALFASCSSKNFGKRLTTRSISRIVKERLKTIGINDGRITAHSLRHTAITLSLMAGATPQEARALARHSDINTTMIYAHNIQRVAQAPELKIDTIL